MRHNYFTLFINKDWGLKLGNKMSKGKNKYQLDGGVHYLSVGFMGIKTYPPNIGGNSQWQEET
jgi:hypothetical protein